MTTTKTSISTTETTTLLPPRICIQGYQGAFHEIASRYYYKEDIQVVPAYSFEELVRKIEQGEEVDAGLMAIENTLAGSIMRNYSLLYDSNLTIIGEVYIRIQQNLMVLPGQRIQDLEEVHSHYMAIAQCRKFFRQYPHIRLIETADTALSAKYIREHQQTNIGAIASTLAADLYELDIIVPSIETNKKNFTRFLVLENQATAQSVKGADKVSLCFATSHEVGSLYKVLAILAAYNVNLTKIQSTPIIGKEWEYRFFVDFVASGTVGWEQAVEAIRPVTTELRLLGAYRQGEHYQ